MYLPEYTTTSPLKCSIFRKIPTQNTLHIVCDYKVITHFPDNVYKKQLTPYICVNMVNSKSGKKNFRLLRKYNSNHSSGNILSLTQ
jgi:hypothetical protein